MCARYPCATDVNFAGDLCSDCLGRHREAEKKAAAEKLRTELEVNILG